MLPIYIHIAVLKKKQVVKSVFVFLVALLPQKLDMTVVYLSLPLNKTASERPSVTSQYGCVGTVSQLLNHEGSHIWKGPYTKTCLGLKAP